MSPRISHFYEFGSFRLDLGERILLRDGEVVALTPKAFETLLALVESNGQVVSKEVLINRIWPDSFVEESNLAQNISTVRKMLGDGVDGNQFIQTIPKRGYRFVAPVKEIRQEIPVAAPFAIREIATNNPGRSEEIIAQSTGEPPGTPAFTEGRPAENSDFVAQVLPASIVPAEINPPPAFVLPATPQATNAPATSASYKHWMPITLAASLIIAFIVGFFWWKSRSLVSPGGNPQRTLAVLPFRNLKPDPELDFLGLALADAIISKMNYVSAITVRPSVYVQKYQNQTIDPKTVAAELNVNTLLACNYIKENDQLRITAELTDIESGRLLLNETLDLKYENLSNVQDKVSQKIIEKLQLRLTSDERVRIGRDSPASAMAYEYFLRGVDRYFANDMTTAIGLFQRSVELDDKYPLAWAHLGTAHTARGSLNFGGREDYEKAQTAYEKSLALNPDLHEARIFLANFYTDTNRVEQSVPLLRDVLKNNPMIAQAHWELGYAYRFGGMIQESITEAERARQLDGDVKINNSVLTSYIYAGQYQKFLDSLPPLDPRAFVTFYRGFGNYYLKNYKTATEAFDKAFDADPTLIQALTGKSLSDGIAGKNTEGLRRLQELERKIERSGVTDAEAIYKVAQAYAMLGDTTSALRLLRRSVEGGFFCFPYFMNDPLLDTLRNEPEFMQVMNSARQRHENFRQKFF